MIVHCTSLGTGKIRNNLYNDWQETVPAKIIVRVTGVRGSWGGGRITEPLASPVCGSTAKCAVGRQGPAGGRGHLESASGGDCSHWHSCPAPPCILPWGFFLGTSRLGTETSKTMSQTILPFKLAIATKSWPIWECYVTYDTSIRCSKEAIYYYNSWSQMSQKIHKNLTVAASRKLNG